MSMMNIAVMTIAGLLIGSFANALIHRFMRNKPASLLTDRSECPSCQHVLSYKDLVPLVSFLLLQGKCRYCKETISWQYPIVELVFALSFIGLFFFVGGYTLYLFYLLFIVSIALITVVMDSVHLHVSPAILWVGTAGSIGYQLLFGEMTFFSLFLGMTMCAAFFLIQWMYSAGEWIGEGDTDIGLFMGATLGFPLGVISIFVGYIIGAFVSLFLILIKKRTAEDRIPLGGYLVIGLVTVMLMQDWFLTTYGWMLQS